MAQVIPRGAPPYVATKTMAGRPWWLQPLAVVTILSAFSIYVIWAALQGRGDAAPYLSPFYSPRVAPWGPIPGAFLVLWVPLGFRASCYYYRKAYYRSYFWDPPACARSEPRPGGYQGERGFPFRLSNLHRYFLYLAILVLAVLWYDTARGFDFDGHFGVGVGSLLLLINVVLLSLYTFSCHSFRHIVGGVACFSCRAAGIARHAGWRGVSRINPQHPLFAWLSLFSVVAVDIYIRLLLAGVFADPRWVS